MANSPVGSDSVSAQDVQIEPTPQPVIAQAPNPAQQSAPVQRLALYMKQGRPDPMWVAAQLNEHPDERAQMIQLLQTTVGNGFVQQVLAAEKGGGNTMPVKFQPDISTLSPTIADGTTLDGGALGTVVTSSATAKAEVDLGTVNATVTSAAAGQEQLMISAPIPLSSIHAGAMLPDEIAQITNVTKMNGIGGTVGWTVAGGILQLTLSGVQRTQALETTLFKLWLASGETIALQVKASTFHVDVSEMDRQEARDAIANEQKAVATEQSEKSTMAQQLLGAGKSTAPADASFDSEIASSESWLAKDQAALATAQTPRFVDVDASGNPIKQPTPAPK